MKNPTNQFKAALKSGKQQIGLWNSLGGVSVPEILAGSGYDWVLVDCEHSGIETIEVLPALQCIGQVPEVSALVRPASNDVVLIKRVLDMGAQTLLIPYVETAEEAEQAVKSMRYAPNGIRGMAGMTRASRYGKVDNYFTTAEDELCLLVQVETAKAVENLDAIATTDGVDGVFIGPADLSASLGHPGQPSHPDVQKTIDHILTRLAEHGVPSGILEFNPQIARDYLAKGVGFVAAGGDVGLLANAAEKLRAEFS